MGNSEQQFSAAETERMMKAHINETGMIVGGMAPIEGSGYQEAFLYDGFVQVIGTPGSSATGVNNGGQVVGYAPKAGSLYAPYFAVLLTRCSVDHHRMRGSRNEQPMVVALDWAVCRTVFQSVKRFENQWDPGGCRWCLLARARLAC